MLLTGRGAAKIQPVLMGRETVIFTLTVKEHSSVVMTIVQVDHQLWTVVHLPAVMTLIA